jgi:tetratricopeptide (TPR) repeat protein
LKQDTLKDRDTSSATGFSGAPLSDRTVALALVLILTMVFLFYLNTLWFAFVHDDVFQIMGNAWLRSWKYLPRYFTADVWAFERSTYHGTFYRPIFLLWFRLQYVVFGLSPWGWHLCTVYCHLAVTFLAYLTAVELLKDRLAALFATLIFGLHPTHAEAVAWISGVAEPLFTVFLFASYLCYLKRRSEPGRARPYLAASLILYALACLAKETAVILPVIIFACEFLWSEWTAPSRWRAWIVRSRLAARVVAPYLAVFAGYLIARLLALRGFHNAKEAHSFLSMLLTWPSVLWFYLQHLLAPSYLIPFYSMEYYSRLDVRNVLLPAIPVALAGVGLFYSAIRSRRVAVATIWMVVPILPVLDLRAFIEGHLVHDRYLYLPSFGFALLLALGIRHLRLGSGQILGQPPAQLILVGLIGLTMGMEIVQATACYADETTYSTYVALTEGQISKSKEGLARQLWQHGHLEQAIRIYEELWPAQQNNWDINFNLGCGYYFTGKFPDADRYLSRAIELDPSQSDGFFYLGLTKLKLGDVNSAAVNVKRAVALAPDTDHYHRTLGAILRLQGDLSGALLEFRQEMDLDPDDTASREQAERIEAELAAARKGKPPSSDPAPGSPAAH